MPTELRTTRLDRVLKKTFRSLLTDFLTTSISCSRNCDALAGILST